MTNQKLFSAASVLIFLSSNILLGQSGTDSKSDDSFSVADLRMYIKERGQLWGKAIRTKDISLIQELYDEEAHYLPNEEAALHGLASIASYWKASFSFLADLALDMHTLEGSREILYETGEGTAKIIGDKDTYRTFTFKYVNVWKLQSNGSYKVVIDIYNKSKPAK